jgi:hypothetical protein
MLLLHYNRHHGVVPAQDARLLPLSAHLPSHLSSIANLCYASAAAAAAIFNRHHALVAAQDARLPQLPAHHASRLHSLQPRRLQQPPTTDCLKLRATTQPWSCPQPRTSWQLQQLCCTWWELWQRKRRGVLSKWPVLQPGGCRV